MIKQKSIASRHHGNIRILTFSAVLVAMSIVCGKYLAFGVGNVLRFSFENLPIILGGVMFGPVVGALIGIGADLIGCILVGYAINPIITLGAAVIGLLSGALWRMMNRLPYALTVISVTVISHIVGSVLIKTFGLAMYYDMPIYVLMLWRLLNYLIVGAVECLLLYFVLKNKSVRSIMARHSDRKE